MKNDKSRGTRKLVTRLVFAGLFIAVLVFGVVYFKKYQDLKSKPPDAKAAAELENKTIIENVGKLYDLPKDEEPEIGRVVDKNQLKPELQQTGVENGDEILIYKKAKILIIYRPSTNKIVKVVPINVEDEQGATPAQSSKVKLRIIGSEAKRDATEATLNEKLKDQIVVIGKTAAKGDYTSVIVVDISGKNADNAKQIASALGAGVADLPAGEDKPSDADILIITPTN